MLEVEVAGCRVSLIARVHRCGSPSETESGAEKTIWTARFFYAQSLSSEISPKQWIPARQNPPGAPEILTGSASQEGIRRLLRSQHRRLGFGQSPQARPQCGRSEER